MQVSIIIPTTEGPASILRLGRLAQAPRSVMRTQDDYRPLPPSERYHAFVQPGGALAARLGPDETGQFELRLDAAVETGRSWELPVALAHLLDRRGAELQAEAPKLILWATGALDNDLCILPQEYHLVRKLELSLPLLLAGLAQGAKILLLLPNAVALPAALQRPEVEVRIIAELDAALAVLDPYQPPLARLVGRARLKPGCQRLTVMLGAGLVGLFLVGLVTALPQTSRIADLAGAQQTPKGGGAGALPASDSEDDTAAAAEAGPAQASTLPDLVLDYAPEGGSCQSVLFGAAPSERRELTVEAAAYPAIRLTGLCLLGFTLPAHAEAEVDVTLPDLIWAQVLPSDRRAALRLEPGDTVLFRLRATLPEALEARIGLASAGAPGATLSIVAHQ